MASPFFFYPEFSAPTQQFLRVAYCILLLGHLTYSLPNSRYFFMSSRWRGYAKSSPIVDVIQNPVILPLTLAIWYTCLFLMLCDRWTVPAALINLLLCRYFFIAMRWRSVTRGMGAPGFCSYWLGAAVFFMEYTSRYAPQMQPLALLVFQIDFAIIIFSSGFYKFNSGYPQNHGMELGLANPEWGYWWRFYKKIPPSHWIFKIYDQSAWLGQLITATLMLIPQTRFWGGLLLALSFMIIIVNIRLLYLGEMVMLIGVVYFVAGSPGDVLISHWWPATPHAISTFPFITTVNAFLEVFLKTYVILLPFVHAGLFLNLYGNRRLPGILQKCLERYANFFGIIVWRVFSPDLIDFFIQIYRKPADPGKPLILFSRWGYTGGPRYGHVAESITVTSLFTTLRYFPSNNELFTEKLLRYAASVPCHDGETALFEYVAIVKKQDGFEFEPVAEYEVDVKAKKVSEKSLSKTFSVRRPDPHSPIHEGVRPGSYIPIKTS